MPIGRTRGLSTTSDARRLLRQVRGTMRELDRRKPVTEPSMFHDDSERPDAETNEGRVVYNTVTGMLQYSDGDSWNDFLASSVSFAAPTVTYGTTAVEGTLATTLRSDATLKYPAALMSSLSSSTLTLTDDITQQTLTGSLGNINYRPASGGGHFLDVDSTTAAAVNTTVQVRVSAGCLTGLQPSFSLGNLSSQTLRAWNVSMGGFAGQLVTSNIIGYDMSTFSVTPAAGSDTANVIYGARIAGALINNTNAGFSDVSGVYITGPRRLASNPTVTISTGLTVECPSISATSQIGVYVKQRTAQQTATTRYGIKVDAQNSGTTRYGIHVTTDACYFGGGTLFDDSVKGKYGTGLDAELYYDGTDFVCDPDVVGTGVFDIRGGLKCDSITNDTGLAHGVYTPTRSAEANLDANVTPSEAQYMRVGNTVTVSGRFTADPTLTATATSFELTLPVASNIGAVEDLAGAAFCGSIAGMGAAVTGSVANNTAVVSWIASDVTSQSWSYVYSYQVV